MRDGSSEYLRNRLYHVFDQKDPIPKMLEVSQSKKNIKCRLMKSENSWKNLRVQLISKSRAK